MAGKYQVGRSWYLSWVENGESKRRSIGPATAAEAEAAKLAKEQSLGERSAAGPLFADWAIKYATWHSQQYPDSYFRVEQILRTHLIPAFGPLALLGITREIVEQYKERRRQEAAPGTVVKEVRTLKACLKHAVAWEIIPRNPIQYVQAPRDLVSRAPRWFSKEELARIYAVEMEVPKCTTKEDGEMHRRYRWSWQLMANTGLRRGEALHLEWRDVGRQEIGVRSEQEARTKSGKWRSIPINNGTREALQEIKVDQRFVFPQIQPESITRAFSRTLGRASLEGSLHCLRHSYCSHLVQAGIPLRTVQVLAGHSSYKTTERYAHLAPSTLRDSIAAMSL